MTTTEIGRQAEDKALAYLSRAGLELVERNFSCSAGEIDLIMRDEETLCFIEVRYRLSPLHASGAESITRTKIRRLITTAEYYLTYAATRDYEGYRFDVVSMDNDIDWIQDAFTAEG